jgi:hypothetical protein
MAGALSPTSGTSQQLATFEKQERAKWGGR